MSSSLPPHLAAAGNARTIVAKMVAVGGLVVAVIAGLIAYGILADDPPAASSFERQATAGGGTAAAVATASLWVDVPPADAQVVVDGDSAGTVPLWLDSVAVGERRIQVFGTDGAVVLDTTVWAEGGSTIDIEASPGGEIGALGAEPIASDAPPQSPLDSPPNTPAPPASSAPAVGDLRVLSTPAGAAVMLDGQRVGTTPFAMGGLAPGMYTVGIARAGYQTAARRVEVRPGGLSESVINLLPLSPEPAEPTAEAPPATGTVEILVRPWGQIVIDGTTHQRETDVVYRTTLTAGPHQIRVSHPRFGSIERTVTIRAGERERVEFDLASGG